jgi:hypothetical protein
MRSPGPSRSLLYVALVCVTSYAQNAADISNPEMAKIYDDDQRCALGRSDKDRLEESGPTDEQHRIAVRQLLKDGKLHTGEDFNKAAFIFQHGGTPGDYLLAHTLAVVAIARGDTSAIWIASATLDRYLMSIKQPQIYGTQYSWNNQDPTTQDPYNRELISDALRQALHVPTLAEQETGRKQMDADRHLPSPAPAH